MVGTMCWIGLILELQHTQFVSENVVAPRLLQMLSDVLGHIYHLDLAKSISPDQFGWPVSRVRQFAHGRHKLKSLPHHSLLTAFVSMFNRKCGIPFTEFMQDAETERNSKKGWAASRVVAKQELDEAGIGGLGVEHLACRQCLAATAELTLDTCIELGGQRRAHLLNQDPRNQRGRSSGETKLHAVAEIGIVFVPELGVWFTPKDALRAQGFTFREDDVPVRPFNLASYHGRRNQTFGQAGEAMRVEVVGNVALYSLTLPVPNGLERFTGADCSASVAKHIAMLAASSKRQRNSGCGGVGGP